MPGHQLYKRETPLLFDKEQLQVNIWKAVPTVPSNTRPTARSSAENQSKVVHDTEQSTDGGITLLKHNRLK
jgi:hypothetical protein